MKINVFALVTFFSPILLSAQCIKGDCFNHYSTFKFPNGNIYTGDFENGLASGLGDLQYKNGNRYSGQWEAGKFNGSGILSKSNGYYEGQFKDGKFNGQGEFHFNNGDIYIGTWKNNRQHGYGTIYEISGTIFEGSFYEGKIHGTGVITQPNGRIVHGIWNFGSMVKKDEYDFLNHPDIDRNCNSILCDSGKGTFQYRNGDTYKGEFSGGRPKGLGKLEYKNGDTYIGGFENDLPHGKGKLSYVLGGEISGEFFKGNLIKEDRSLDIKPQDSNNIIREEDINIYAVIIGISDYPRTSIDLIFSDDDANRLYNHLRSPEGGALRKSQIRKLTNQEATKQNILAACKEMFLKADENDLVIFYYSGHGLRNGFIPYDLSGDNQIVYHRELSDIFNASNAKQKVIIADACHAGSLGYLTEKGLNAPQEDLSPSFYQKLYETEEGYAFILSSKSREVSYEHDGLRAGVFSHFLINGLKGKANFNNDDLINISELFKYTKMNVHKFTEGKQTPIIFGKIDGQMPLSAIK